MTKQFLIFFSINEILPFFASIDQNQNYFRFLFWFASSKFLAEFSNQKQKDQEVLYLIYCYSLFSLDGAKIQNTNAMTMRWNSDRKRLSIST